MKVEFSKASMCNTRNDLTGRDNPNFPQPDDKRFITFAALLK